MGGFIIWFGGGALAYAAVVTLIGGAVSLSLRGAVPWRTLPLVFVAATFVFLTQHPFPALGSLDCPVTSAAPQLQLFRFLTIVEALHEDGTPLSGWLSSRWFMATVMNFGVILHLGNDFAVVLFHLLV